MKKLIVISADALVAEDVEYLETLPNFKKYLAGGVGVRKVHSVYPTITYPCHTTMITGVYPDTHKVTGNLSCIREGRRTCRGSGIINTMLVSRIFLRRQKRQDMRRLQSSGR